MSQVNVKRIHSLRGHTDSVYALEGSDEPHLFFSAAGDGMVVLWDLTKPGTGQLIARLPNSIYALHYLRSMDLLVGGHNHDGIHVLDWKNKKEIRSMQLTSSAIFDIQSSGDDLFVACGDGRVLVIGMDSWKVRVELAASARSARTLAVNPARRELAVGYSDNAIRIFDLDDLRLKNEWFGHQNSVFTLSYSRDFKTLFSGSRDAKLKIWDAAADYVLRGEVAAHMYAINNLVFSGDGKHFVTCSLDKSIKVWMTDELRLLKVIDKTRHGGHGTSVNKLRWTSFNNQLLSASDDHTICVWDLVFSQVD